MPGSRRSIDEGKYSAPTTRASWKADHPPPVRPRRVAMNESSDEEYLSDDSQPTRRVSRSQLNRFERVSQAASIRVEHDERLSPLNPESEDETANQECNTSVLGSIIPAELVLGQGPGKDSFTVDLVSRGSITNASIKNYLSIANHALNTVEATTGVSNFKIRKKAIGAVCRRFRDQFIVKDSKDVRDRDVKGIWSLRRTKASTTIEGPNGYKQQIDNSRHKPTNVQKISILAEDYLQNKKAGFELGLSLAEIQRFEGLVSIVAFYPRRDKVEDGWKQLTDAVPVCSVSD